MSRGLLKPTALVLLWSVVLPVCEAQVLRMERVSLCSDGAESSTMSFHPAISGNGRFVAFESYYDFEAHRSAGTSLVWVHDRRTHKTHCACRGLSGLPSGQSGFPAISGSGRYVAFKSYSSSLVPGDTNGKSDIFVYDQKTRTISRVSVASGGSQANDWSASLDISRDGRYVAFTSPATNLVPDDTNAAWDVFVHDRATKQTERVSLSNQGKQLATMSQVPALNGNGRFVAYEHFASPDGLFLRDRALERTRRIVIISGGGRPGPGVDWIGALSWSGRWVVFESLRSNLLPQPIAGGFHVYVRDMRTRAVELASIADSGEPANDRSCYLDSKPSISASGRLVAFDSCATNLAPGDTRTYDVFVRDRQLQRTVRVSQTPAGEPGNDLSWFPRLSGDGLAVAFTSDADNLVPHDTNGTQDVFVAVLKPPEEWPVAASPPASAQVTSLSAVPTGSGTVQVNFTLAAAGAITAEVLNLAGRPVATVARGAERKRGAQTLLWSGRGANGLRVPSGVYMVRLQARTAAGQTSQAIATINLRD